MFKHVFAVAVCAVLLTPYATAQSRLLMPKEEQPEDMRYYQPYKWDTPIERKTIYEAKANGQYHMLEKLATCQIEADNLEQWLTAFKKGSQEVGYTESDFDMRDMDDNQIHDPDDGNHVSKWLVRDYAEKHYVGYTGKNLAKLQDGFFSHCLAKLPVKLFTKEARDFLEAKNQAEIDREMAYP
ncbi:hypothetical protein SAMN05660691_01599 [Rheinheimera pacifica]|uniref:Uncharacterized protein n=1 Tax=Rheinheimera pacifica TaxID=173990 RepID=A0A1H6L4W2_9GAMM|nr:hypothetical protein [Rheinheimera pacifica]SEH80949.1 hypothetical protein SAMN05660691_01599 [Rheinheimera pacifica]